MTFKTEFKPLYFSLNLKKTFSIIDIFFQFLRFYTPSQLIKTMPNTQALEKL